MPLPSLAFTGWLDGHPPASGSTHGAGATWAGTIGAGVRTAAGPDAGNGSVAGAGAAREDRRCCTTLNSVKPSPAGRTIQRTIRTRRRITAPLRSSCGQPTYLTVGTGTVTMHLDVCDPLFGPASYLEASAPR